ncbi:MAG: AAA family ATPase, partial [Candidatus Sericytochromatia bacterium]
GEPGGAYWLAAPAGTAGLAEPAWLQAAAGRAGLGHAAGACQGASGAPYAPWLAVLEALLPVARAEATAALSAHGPVLQALLPEIGAPLAAALPPASERLRLQGACAAVVKAIAEARGLVLVVEEAQEADPLSLELTAAVARLAHEAPLLLVVTSRGLASPIPPERARFDRFEVTAEAEAATASQRLEALSTDALPIARIAALAGSELDEALLQEASGMPDAAIGLGHLLGAGLLLRRATGRLAFAPAAREAVIQRMSEGSRARGHRALALALQGRLGRHAPDSAPLEALTALAHHALASGSADWAIAPALAAGERHARLHALETAQALFEAALDRLRSQGTAAPPATLCRALGRLGDVHRVAGRYALARSAYEEAIPLAEGPAASGMWTSLAQAHQGLDQLAEALAASEKAIATSDGDPSAAARAFLTSARLLVYRGETAEARDRLARALGLARAAGDSSREGEALAFLGYMRLSAGEGGFEHMHAAIAVQARIGDEVGLCMSHMILGNAELRHGEYAGAARSFTTARRLADRLGNPTEGGIAAINLAIVA